MKLRNSVTSALWHTGSFWIVAFLAYVFDQPREVVGAIVIVGLIAAFLEWIMTRSN